METDNYWFLEKDNICEILSYPIDIKNLFNLMLISQRFNELVRLCTQSITSTTTLQINIFNFSGFARLRNLSNSIFVVVSEHLIPYIPLSLTKANFYTGKSTLLYPFQNMVIKLL